MNLVLSAVLRTFLQVIQKNSRVIPLIGHDNFLPNNLIINDYDLITYQQKMQSSANIVTVTKLRGVGASNTCGGMRNICSTLFENPKLMDYLRDLVVDGDNIKINLKEIECEGVD
jgi:hypothetical protein